MHAPRNVGGLVTVTKALRPRDQIAAGSYGLAGIVINRLKYSSGLFIVSVGPSVGTPDSFAVDAKLQDCDTTGGTYADVAADGSNPAVAITQITTINTDRWLEIDFSKLREFIKLQFQVTFVNGSTPKVGLEASCVLLPIIRPPTHA